MEPSKTPRNIRCRDMPIGKYRGTTLRRELVHLIEEYVKAHPEMGYKSLADFITDAIREKFMQLRIFPTMPEPPKLEHFNISEQGLCILDRTLGDGVSKGHIIDVHFKPENAWCEYCQTKNCRHVEFALNIPKVKKILKQKGWPISKK